MHLENESPLVKKTAAFVKDVLLVAEGGHDWQHIQRVVQNAQQIAAKEACNMEIVLLGALLHDIADSKFHGGDEQKGPAITGLFLDRAEAPPQVTEHVVQIIRNVSYSGGITRDFYSIELAIVQDADRLDALGAIGIARAFNYGGFKNRLIFDPAVPPVKYSDKEAYKNNTAPTINHFYEKLLLLKDGMHTKTAKAMAKQRHRFMETFLEQFFNEVGSPAFSI